MPVLVDNSDTKGLMKSTRQLHRFKASGEGDAIQRQSTCLMYAKPPIQSPAPPAKGARLASAGKDLGLRAGKAAASLSEMNQ